VTGRFGFLGRRVLQLIPVALGITILVFFLLRLVPGDPARQILGNHYTPKAAAAIHHKLGLDEPVWTQYKLFMDRLVHGELGDSVYYNQSAGSLVAQRLPATLFLIAYAGILAALISIPIGIIAALRRGGIFDQATRIATLITFAMPPFWFGIILILFFALKLQLFPVSGYGHGLSDHVWHLFLPALTIALAFSTILTRTLRASMLSTLRMDFVDTARIKGVSRTTVLLRHVVRNAIVSIVVVFGINLAFLVGGTVIVENVFSIPGLGQLLVESVSSRDYPVVQGTTLVLAFFVVLVNLVTDVVHAALDPRVTYE
jgi:ABC-type dipeptide/oligopeptide/nickel transport system permease component